MSRMEKENRKLTREIIEIHKESRFTYGSPRIHAELRERGYFIGHNRVARLMRLNKIRAKTKRRFKITTHSKHRQPISPNLLKEVEIVKPNQVWASDITYIRTCEGWLHIPVKVASDSGK